MNSKPILVIIFFWVVKKKSINLLFSSASKFWKTISSRSIDGRDTESLLDKLEYPLNVFYCCNDVGPWRPEHRFSSNHRVNTTN